MKILNVEDLKELKEMGYQINLEFKFGIRRMKWVNPKTLWNCQIFDGSKKVLAQLYAYISKTDKSNVKLIRY